MAKGRGDFTEILLKKQVLSSDQLAEARTMAQQSGAKLQDALVKLGYCSVEEVMKAIEKGSAPVLIRLLGTIASRFEVVVAEKILAEAIPVIGAAGGAAINTAFTDYFNRTAYYHFGLRFLEKKHGPQTIEQIYSEAMKA